MVNGVRLSQPGGTLSRPATVYSLSMVTASALITKPFSDGSWGSPEVICKSNIWRLKFNEGHVKKLETCQDRVAVA